MSYEGIAAKSSEYGLLYEAVSSGYLSACSMALMRVAKFLYIRPLLLSVCVADVLTLVGEDRYWF